MWNDRFGMQSDTAKFRFLTAENDFAEFFSSALADLDPLRLAAKKKKKGNVQKKINMHTDLHYVKRINNITFSWNFKQGKMHHKDNDFPHDTQWVKKNRHVNKWSTASCILRTLTPSHPMKGLIKRCIRGFLNMSRRYCLSACEHNP